VISLSIKAAAEKVIATHAGDVVEVILEGIASETPQYKKLILQATMNSYSLLVDHAQSSNFDSFAVRYF